MAFACCEEEEEEEEHKSAAAHAGQEEEEEEEEGFLHSFLLRPSHLCSAPSRYSTVVLTYCTVVYYMVRCHDALLRPAPPDSFKGGKVKPIRWERDRHKQKKL